MHSQHPSHINLPGAGITDSYMSSGTRHPTVAFQGSHRTVSFLSVCQWNQPSPKHPFLNTTTEPPSEALWALRDSGSAGADLTRREGSFRSVVSQLGGMLPSLEPAGDTAMVPSEMTSQDRQPYNSTPRLALPPLRPPPGHEGQHTLPAQRTLGSRNSSVTLCAQCPAIPDSAVGSVPPKCRI